MKIMFLTSEGFDTPNSINHLCETLLEDLLRSGVSVYSISSHTTGTYQDIPASLLQYENFEYDIIHRKRIDKNNFVKRYLYEIKYVFQARKLWKNKKVDGVLLQSNPNSVYHSILIKLFLKCPIVLNLYDVFPGHAMSIGVMKNKFIYAVLNFIQRILYKNCDKIVAMSEDMETVLLQQKIPKEKIQVIHNWFDDSVFSVIPKESNKFFQKYDLPTDVFYVQFAGLLGYVFDYRMFVDVAVLLKDNPNIRFLLIGDGNQKDAVYDYIKEKNADNILCFPWQPLDIIADVYSACDIGFIPLKKGVIGNGIPSKACQLMAASRVVLNFVEESDYTKLFDAKEMGVSITSGKPQDVADKIIELCEDPVQREYIGKNAKEYAYEYYSREKNTSLFVELIKKEVNQK